MVLKWLVMLGIAVARIVLSKPTRVRERPMAIMAAANLTPVGHSDSSGPLGSATSISSYGGVLRAKVTFEISTSQLSPPDFGISPP
jgi:hypothetical protein